VVASVARINTEATTSHLPFVTIHSPSLVQVFRPRVGGALADCEDAPGGIREDAEGDRRLARTRDSA